MGRLVLAYGPTCPRLRADLSGILILLSGHSQFVTKRLIKKIVK